MPSGCGSKSCWYVKAAGARVKNFVIWPITIWMKPEAVPLTCGGVGEHA
jgi:hypothetical protein